jgi:hypothetical protein
MHTASSSDVGRGSRSWSQGEFSSACLPDRRLVKRLMTMATDFLDNISSSIPEACGGHWSKTKGAYRLLDNDGVTPQNILSSHVTATATRMREHRVVLAVQDTTALNFSRHPQTEGLGLLGSHSDKTLGIFLHATMAISLQGVALGIIDGQTWTRPIESRGKAQRRAQTPLEQKESNKWLKSFAATVQLAKALPQTQIVSVADREGDLYDLFVAASTQPQVGVLVRSKQSRPLQGQQEFSWQSVATQNSAGTVEVQVPRKPGKAGRTAEMEIRYKEATLRPPVRKAEQRSIVVWLVEAREINSSEKKPLVWRLVTTVPVWTVEQAAERLRWYEMRWLMEEFHRVLKSGCGVEKRQLETVKRLEKVLMLDMIVAWKVLEMSRSAREEPASPAERQLEPQEVQMLKVLLKKKSDDPLQMREAVRKIAQLGGFLGRKHDGEPGVMTIWRGRKRLEQLAEGYALGMNCG